MVRENITFCGVTMHTHVPPFTNVAKRLSINCQLSVQKTAAFVIFLLDTKFRARQCIFELHLTWPRSKQTLYLLITDWQSWVQKMHMWTLPDPVQCRHCICEVSKSQNQIIHTAIHLDSFIVDTEDILMFWFSYNAPGAVRSIRACLSKQSASLQTDLML